MAEKNDSSCNSTYVKRKGKLKYCLCVSIKAVIEAHLNSKVQVDPGYKHAADGSYCESLALEEYCIVCSDNIGIEDQSIDSSCRYS